MIIIIIITTRFLICGKLYQSNSLISQLQSLYIDKVNSFTKNHIANQIIILDLEPISMSSIHKKTIMKKKNKTKCYDHIL